MGRVPVATRGAGPGRPSRVPRTGNGLLAGDTVWTMIVLFIDAMAMKFQGRLKSAWLTWSSPSGRTSLLAMDQP